MDLELKMLYIKPAKAFYFSVSILMDGTQFFYFWQLDFFDDMLLNYSIKFGSTSGIYVKYFSNKNSSNKFQIECVISRSNAHYFRLKMS